MGTKKHKRKEFDLLRVRKKISPNSLIDGVLPKIGDVGIILDIFEDTRTIAEPAGQWMEAGLLQQLHFHDDAESPEVVYVRSVIAHGDPTTHVFVVV